MPIHFSINFSPKASLFNYNLEVRFSDGSGKSVDRLENSVGVHVDIDALWFGIGDATQCSLDEFSKDNHFWCISFMKILKRRNFLYEEPRARISARIEQ